MIIKLYEKKIYLPKKIYTNAGIITYGINYFLSLEHQDIIAYGEASPNPFKNNTTLIYSHMPKDVKEDLIKLISLIKFDKINFSLIKTFHKEYSSFLSETKAAFDMLFHDFISKKEQKEVWEFYSEEKNKNSFLAKTIGTNNPEKIKQFIKQEKTKISFFKIKGTKENINKLPLDFLSKYNVIIDFNGLFQTTEEFIMFLKNVPKDNDFIFEEPFSINIVTNENISKIRKALKDKKINLIFDDCFFDDYSLNIIKNKKIGDGLNLKIQKLGGIYPCYTIYKQNKQFQYVIGCMLETSLGISASTQLGRMLCSKKNNPLILDLDSDIFIGLEPNSPKITKAERKLKEKYGVGFTPDLINAKLIYSREL